MIVRKHWQAKSIGGRIIYEYEGWFLFGFMPLYVHLVGYK